MVALTLVIALFTYLVWRVYERIAWFTGAMESQSDIMMRIEARRGVKSRPIELVWWDPTIEAPPIAREHGARVDLRRIYVYLPPSMRKNNPSFWRRLRAAFH
jgi:hypothetical protein